MQKARPGFTPLFYQIYAGFESPFVGKITCKIKVLWYFNIGNSFGLQEETGMRTLIAGLVFVSLLLAYGTARAERYDPRRPCAYITCSTWQGGTLVHAVATNSIEPHVVTTIKVIAAKHASEAPAPPAKAKVPLPRRDPRKSLAKAASMPLKLCKFTTVPCP